MTDVGALSHVSIGDVIAGVVCLAMLVKMMLGERRRGRRQTAEQAVKDAHVDGELEDMQKAIAELAASHKRIVDQTADRAVKTAQIDGQLREMKTAISELATSHKQMVEKFTEHDRKDAEFHGEIAAILRAQAETAAKVQRDIERFSALVGRLMPPADTFSEIVPPTNRRRPPGS